MDVPFIGAGFDLWEGERLVHRHRNRRRLSPETA
jgi:hypothetical protein